MSLRNLFRKTQQSTKTSRAIRRLKPWTAVSLSLENLEERLAPATLDWLGAVSTASSAPGLNGAYYNLTATQGLIDDTNAAWLGNPANNYTPAATAVLTGPIDFPNISGNGFQDTSGTTYYNIPGNNNNVEGRWTGDITIPATAGGGGTNPVPISFATTSDDGSVLYLDGNLVVNNNNFQGATQQTGTVSLVPGSVHTIDIEYYQGGGGASMDAEWDLNGGTNFGDIPNSAFSIPSSAGSWSNAANWVNVATSANQAPVDGDTVVFNSTATGTGAYNAVNDITGLTLNGIVVQNTGSTPYVITGNAVSIDNTDPTLTSGISDQSTTSTVLGLTSIALAANTNIDNTSAFPASVTSTPNLLIASNIDLAGQVLSSGPSLADEVSGTPDTGLTEISGVVSSSVANTDAVVESGYGVLALAGNNTYDGTTSVFNGLLVAAANNSLGATTGGAKTVNPTANPLPSSPGAALGIGLAGDNAAYTNGVTIQGAGPSVLGGALWSASATSSVFNAPITLAGATTFNISSGGSLTLGGPLNLGVNALTITGNDNLTISNVITGSASSSITDTDTATTTLSGNNAPYLGPININAGILAAGANNALGVGTGAVTVANGATLGFTNNVNYTTAQPVSITGSGSGNNGAVQGIGGTDTFAGPITVASGNEYLGATAGQLTLTAPISLTSNNLVLLGNGGNLVLSGAISGPATSTITKSGTGTATLSANNSGFLGATTIQGGLLVAAANNALGDGVHSTVTVLSGGLGFSGGINYSTPQAVSITGSGTTGNGAIENLSGSNSFAGPITLNLGGDATIGADSGSSLSLSGAINLFGQTLTVTGAGNTTISGIISGTGSGTLNNVLSGAYYNLNPLTTLPNGGSQLINNTQTTWLGNPANNYVPAATAALIGPIDFPNIQVNGFQDTLGTTYYNLGNGNNNNVEARWVGQINIPGTGSTPVPINFATTSDDGSTLYIDGNLVVNNNASQGATTVTSTQTLGSVLMLTPGLHAIDVEYYQGGGGASMDAQWDPTGGSTFVDIPNSVLSVMTPGTNNLVKTGSGTLSLSGNNTYSGTTTIDAGTVLAANNNAFGSPTGGGVTVNNGSDVALPAAGGITLPAGKALTISGNGPAGSGAIQNLGSNNTVAGNITLAANASVGSNLTTTPVTVPNFSFETPNLSGGYAYNPTGASWNFVGQSGIAANGSGFGPPNAPDGTQAGLVQILGSFSQSLTLPAAGAYLLTFAAAGRNGAGPNPFTVSVDGTQVGSTITPVNNVYATYTVTFTVATAGAHTLAFTGLGNGGNDVTSFIDDVTLAAVPANPDTLTLSGNVALNGETLTATGAGNTTISGVISGSSTAPVNGLNGQFFDLTAAQNLIAPAVASNASWLGNQTPVVSAVLTGPIDFQNIAGNGFQDTLGTTYYDPVPGNNQNVEARWYGSILIPGTGTAPVPISFGTSSDDGSVLYIDGNLVVNNNNFQGSPGYPSLQVTNTVMLTPGLHSIDVEYFQGGGGASLWVEWDPAGGSNFVDIPNSALFIVPTNGVTKNGTGTLTLSNTNTYTGATTINAGVVAPTVDGAMGPATAAGITVNSGAALVFAGGLTYATAEPTTIAGNGPSGKGAIESISGTNSFAGPITLAGNTTIGVDAGTLSLSGGITGTGTLTLAGAGNTTITGGITLTTGDLDVVASGVTTLSGPVALGSGNVNLNGPGAIMVSGAISFTGGGNLTISSTGVTNVSGAVTLGSPSSGNILLTGSGPATLSGAINLGGGNIVDTNGGQDVISGNVSGNVGSAPGLNGQYYVGSGVTNAELSTLTALTPAVSEVLTGSNTAAPNSAPAGSMINLTDISQAANDSFMDALTAGGAPGPNLGTNNIGAIWTGSITIPATAGGGGTSAVPITFLTGSDDGSTVWIDGNQVVFNDFGQGVTYRAGIVNLVPGSTHSIIITYYQGGGGASMFLNWDLTGATPANYVSGNSAGVPIPTSAFSIPGDTVTMNGTGTLTLSGNNSYIGQTSVNKGTLVVGANNALGATGATVAAGARMSFPASGGLNYTTPTPVTIFGSGPGGNGSLENVSGANAFGAAITLGGNATIGSDAGTLTLTNSTLNLALNNLTTTGAGNLVISSAIQGAAAAPNEAYVGFTGGDGGASSTQQILNWTYTSGTTNINDSSGFTGSNLVLNGGASIVGTALQLTDGNGGEARSAFTPTPVTVGAFTSTFQFQFTNPGADGFTFAIQNSGPTAIGGGGGGLAYSGIGNSLAVEFNMYNNVSQFGVDLNGTVSTPTDLTQPANGGLNFHTLNGSNQTDVFQVTVVYNGSNSLAVTLSDVTAGSTPVTFTFNLTVPTTTFNNLTQAGTGTTTLSGNNTYLGLTTVSQGTLIAGSVNALGSTASGTTVASGATLGIQGGITLAAEPLTLNGGGAGGVGALANVSGNNTLPQPISLATDSTIGSETVGNTLTLGGNIVDGNANLSTNLTFTGAGNILVNGVIQTVAATTGLIGNYYDNINPNNGGVPLNTTNSSSLFFQTPAVTEPLTGSNTAPPNNAPAGSAIVLNQISETANDSFTDALTTGGAPGPNIGLTSIGALWVGQITIPASAGGTSPVPITFFTASDDGSRLWLNGTGLTNPGTLVVDNDFDQGVTQRQGTINLVPGNTYNIVIGYYQGGGGAAMSVGWDLTGGNTNTPIPISAFSYQPPGIANVTKNGSGTVTLAAANTYTGTTTINNGILQVSGDANLGSTAASAVTINAGTLEATGTFTSSHDYVLGNAASTIMVDANQTLTIPNAILGTGALNKTGAGTLALTAVNAYPGGTTVTQGTLSTGNDATLGQGTVTLAGGLLSLGDTSAPTQPSVPLALSGFNQDVIWTASEATPAVGTTTSLDGAGNVLYDTTVFSPGGGLPANGTFVSHVNSAVAFQLQPYTANNVLLATDTTAHTLTLTNPEAVSALNILDLATNGAATYSLTLHFQDGTSDSTTFSSETASDWFTGSGYAIGGLGRVLQTTPTYSGLPTNPGMFELDLTLPAADQAKVLTALTFTRVSGGTLAVFAVDGVSAAGTLTNKYVNNVVVTAPSTINVQTVPATLGGLSIGSQTLTVTGVAATSLTLGGTTLSGNPTFSAAASTPLTLGSLNDGGTARTITVTGPTTLVAAATSLVNGTTVNITGGALNSNNATALGTMATVAVSTGASFNLGASQTVAALTGTGTVNLNGNTLTIAPTVANPSSFGGTLQDGSSSGGLTINGAGTFILAAGGTYSYTGPTTVSAGKLQVDGNLSASTVSVSSGATLGGSGTVHAVSAASGGTVSPGDSPGILGTGNFTLATGAILQEELGGTTAGTQYDQVLVSSGSTITLNSGGGAGATLNIVLVNGFLPTPGQTFTIINNQGTNAVVGTFAQGATYSANGYVYAINYAGGANNDSVVLTVMALPGPVTHFQVAASPASVVAGTPGAVSFTVTALDANNKTVPTYTGTVTFGSSDSQAVFTVSSYTFTGGGTGNDNGVHTFTSDATLKTAGNQTINVADAAINGSLSPSNAVTVTPGPFAEYVVSFPGGSTVTAGSSFLFTVQATDAYGNTVSSYSGPGSVAVAVSPVDPQGNIPTPVGLSSSGQGFSLGTLKTAGSYTLSVTGTQGSNTYTGTSSALTVTPAAASQLAFFQQPTNTTAGNAIAPPVTVKIKGPYGNLETGDNTDQVTVGIASGPGSFTGSSTVTATASGGIATFGNLHLNSAGTYTLSETATGGLSGPASSSFTVAASGGNQLVFGQQPTNTPAGNALAPAVTVKIEDSLGNVVTSDNTDQVTVGIASGPGSFTGGSTTTVTVVNGIATFSNLVLTTAGTYTLSETATGGLTGPASNAFNVTFVVTSFTPTATGFVVTFSQPFNDATSPTPQINLYNASSINAGPADVTIVSNTTGKAITGSLFIDPSNSKITFIKTTLDGTNGAPLANSWGLLPAGSYTVTLVSSAQAFETTGGLLLDGTDSGVAGSNYTTTFTVSPPASNAVIVTVPDFARGPDATDTINVPNNASPAVGIPIDLTVLAPTQTIAFGSGVTGGSFRLSFNGSPTGAITWSSNTTTLATNIKNALGALANVGGSANVNVNVTGTTQLTATVTFAATVANPNLMTVSLNSLTPSGSTITITNPNAPASVTSATFTLDYNATLLTISGGTVNATLGGTNTFTVTTSGSGANAQATITFTSSAGLTLGTLGTVLLGGLTAIVPTNATYKSKALLHFDLTSSPPSVNGGTVPVVSSDGLQVVDFFGDTNGDGFYTSADAANISRVAGKADTGFGTFPVVDPAIIANLSDTGLVNSGDAVTLNSYLNGGSPAQVPPYPGAPSNNPSGPDPTLSLPTDVAVGADGTVTVPVNIDDPQPAGSNGLTEATLALTYDPSVLSVTAADVQLGSVPQAGSGWKVQAAVDQATGQLGITLFSATPLASAEGGSLVTITFHVTNPAQVGTTAVDLVGSVNPTGHLLIATALDDAQGPLTLPAVPAAADGVVSAGSVQLGAAAPAAAAGSVQDPAALPMAVAAPEATSVDGSVLVVGASPAAAAADSVQGPTALPTAGAATEAATVDGSVVVVETAPPSATARALAATEVPAVIAVAAGGAAESNSAAAPTAVVSGTGLAGVVVVSQQTVAVESAGTAQEAVAAVGLPVHSVPLPVAATTEATALPASVGNVVAAPTSHASEAARSPTTVAATAGPGQVFQVGNGTFLSTTAPANSPQQQLTDRVFRSVGQDRADPSNAPLMLGQLADGLARSLVADLLPADSPQGLFDSLFGEGNSADLDWLDELAAALEVMGQGDASADQQDGTVGAATADQDGVDQSFADGGDGGAESAGAGGE